MTRPDEIEGEVIMGWPDRRALQGWRNRDAQGRVVYARTPFGDLEGPTTPTDLRYVKAQLETPEPVHPGDWRLSISGAVNSPITLTLDELRSLPGRTVRVVTECSGHDAHFFDWQRTGGESHGCDMHQPEPGKPDRFDLDAHHAGLVSSGEFTGVSLATVLNEVGLTSSAAGVRAEGFDRGTPSPEASYDVAEVPNDLSYDKCLPLEKAMDPDTVLAWALNGDYLRHVHGAPARLIVPGWSGNWSVKWLHKLEITDRIVPAWYQSRYFYYADSPQDEGRTAVTTMGVKSVITSPRDDDQPFARGRQIVRGLAWSGRGAIARVEVSIDGGHTWSDAHIEELREKWLWVRWSHEWHANQSGKYAICARAVDETGRIQPQTPWNYLRKNFDGIVPVEVEVA